TPVGPNSDPFVMGIFGAFKLMIASEYTGIAKRAIQVAAEVATTRRNVTRRIVHADDPDPRSPLADAAIGVGRGFMQIEKLLADLDALGPGEPGPGVIDHWPL